MAAFELSVMQLRFQTIALFLVAVGFIVSRGAPSKAVAGLLCGLAISLSIPISAIATSFSAPSAAVGIWRGASWDWVTTRSSRVAPQRRRSGC